MTKMTYPKTLATTMKQEFEAALLDRMEKLVKKRKASNLSQTYMANVTGVSLRTVQRFENYEQLNPLLIFAYNKILKEIRSDEQQQ